MLALWKTCEYPGEKGVDMMRIITKRLTSVNICAQLYSHLSTVFAQLVVYSLSFVYEVLAMIVKLSTVVTTTPKIDNQYI